MDCLLFNLIIYINMTSIPDFIDLKGTQRPDKALIKAISQNFEPL